MRSLLKFVFLIFACAVASFDFFMEMAVAAEDTEKPMRFALVRSALASCEPNCPQWISAYGRIDGDTAIKFERFMKKIGSKPFPIVITSAGGRVEAAMQIGRLVRKLKVDVAVGGTSFSGCSPDDDTCELPKERKGVYSGFAFAGGYCNSACPLILAAGTQRVVGSWSFVGVHQITTTWITSQVQYKVRHKTKNGKKVILDKKIVSRKKSKSYTTTKLGKTQRNKIEKYYSGMGVDPKILDISQETAASDIHQLRQVEMLTLRLITSLDQVELLTGTGICKGDKPAANCIEDDSKILAAATVTPSVPKTKPVAAPVSVVAAPKPLMPAITPKIFKRNFVTLPPTHEMWFVVVQSDEPNCKATCPAWISADGLINAGTTERFERFLKQRNGLKLPIVLNSADGRMDEAIKLGAAVRAHQLDVAIGKTTFSGCDQKAGRCDQFSPDKVNFGGKSSTVEAYCGLFCAAVLAGGIKRYAGKFSYVGLGQWASSYPEVPEIAKAALRHHFENMGVDPYTLYLILNTDPLSPNPSENKARFGHIKTLLLNDMLKLKLATGSEEVDTFTGPANCETKPPAKNCFAPDAFN